MKRLAAIGKNHANAWLGTEVIEGTQAHGGADSYADRDVPKHPSGSFLLRLQDGAGGVVHLGDDFAKELIVFPLGDVHGDGFIVFVQTNDWELLAIGLTEKWQG